MKKTVKVIPCLDIAATVEKRGARLEWVRNGRKEITVLFVVGGGIRNTADMQELLNISSSQEVPGQQRDPGKTLSGGAGSRRLERCKETWK